MYVESRKQWAFGKSDYKIEWEERMESRLNEQENRVNNNSHKFPEDSEMG